MIIGVTGPICAGNNAVGDILRKKGFNRLSFSDELREYMKENNLEINRENMRNTGDTLRKKNGPGAMAIITMKKINPEKDYVVEGIMNPAEVTELKKLKDFYLLKVDAPLEIRFKRLLVRNRDPDEPKEFNAFVEWEKRDLGIGQPAHGLHRAACFELADFTVINDGSLKQLEKNILDLVNKVKQNT
jgi:dephospho-CoA kinase